MVEIEIIIIGIVLWMGGAFIRLTKKGVKSMSDEEIRG